MNILGLIFSLMLIFSYTFYCCWNKQLTANRLRSVYVSHEKAHRELLNQYQRALYNELTQGIPPTSHRQEKKENAEENSSQKPSLPPPNPDCAKLNIWPLIQEGRSSHPFLYEMAAQLLSKLYPQLLKEKQQEYKILDELIAAAKKTEQEEALFVLEKIALPTQQQLYYKMLKGTQKWDLGTQLGYPPLLDYLKSDPNASKICLHHAHPDVFTSLFGQEVSQNIYPEIHRQSGPALTWELIEKFCNEAYSLSPDPQLQELLEFNHKANYDKKRTLVAEEKEMQLRKTVYLR